MTRWRDNDAPLETRTIFDYARHESPRRRAAGSGLNVIRAVTLATAQERQHDPRAAAPAQNEQRVRRMWRGCSLGRAAVTTSGDDAPRVTAPGQDRSRPAVRGARGRARAVACLCRLTNEPGGGFTQPHAFVGSPPSSLSPPGPGIPRYAPSAHPGGTGVSGSGASLSVVAAGGGAESGVGASLSVLAAGGGAAVSGVGASLSVLAAGGGTAASVVGASLSALAAAGGVGRDRDPRPARVVEPRGARVAFAVPAAFRVPAAEDFVLRRVLASARGVVALFSPLASDAGVAAGSRRSISSASARSSATAARATRWAFLPALSLTPLSALAACLRRPTCRSRSNRSASFLAIIYLLALHEIAPSQPYRRLHR